MINKAVLSKWNVANGGGRGPWVVVGGVAMAFKGMGMLGWHSPPPALLPLFMCHSLVSHVSRL